MTVTDCRCVVVKVQFLLQCNQKEAIHIMQEVHILMYIHILLK